MLLLSFESARSADRPFPHVERITGRPTSFRSPHFAPAAVVVPLPRATIEVQVSKKFKGRPCAYCVVATATTDDHVFAREFFTLEDRYNLPKAPACPGCNNKKGQFEHYLTTVLPFAGRHPQAVASLERGVPGRLAKNQKLNRELLVSMKPAWLREDNGLYQLTRTVDFDGTKLEGWLGFVGRGLAWHHWNVYLRPGDEVRVMFMPDIGSAVFQCLISNMRPANKVEKNLGNGTIQYVGLQAADPPQLTVWTIRMYGGLVLSDDRTKADGQMESCSVWWVISGPPELNQRISRMKP